MPSAVPTAAAAPILNRVLLSVQVVERSVMRYTPAGLPALDVRLSHASQVVHAGHPRQVSMELHATAIGDTALELDRLALGNQALVTGFLAKQRNGRSIMLHITRIERVSHDPVSNVPDSN